MSDYCAVSRMVMYFRGYGFTLPVELEHERSAFFDRSPLATVLLIANP